MTIIVNIFEGFIRCADLPRRFNEEAQPRAAVGPYHAQWQPFGEDVVQCGTLMLDRCIEYRA